FHRTGMAHIGLHRMDLAHAAERLQMPRQLRPAHGDANPVSALGQRAHHMAADEAGAAENDHELIDVKLPEHGILCGLCVQRGGDSRWPNTGSASACIGRSARYLTSRKPLPYLMPEAQVAELVDALVSGTSGASRGGSSPLLGTTHSNRRSASSQFIAAAVAACICGRILSW